MITFNFNESQAFDLMDILDVALEGYEDKLERNKPYNYYTPEDIEIMKANMGYARTLISTLGRQIRWR